MSHFANSAQSVFFSDVHQVATLLPLSGNVTSSIKPDIRNLLHCRRRRTERLGYCEQSQPSIAELYSDIDDTFFSRILSHSKHILQQFLHESRTLSDQEIIAKF